MPTAEATELRQGNKTFMGHPRGLFYLAFTEGWERFSFYEMTALVVLFRRSGLFFEIPVQFELFFMLLTAAATGWSAIHYLSRGVGMVRPERRAAV